MLAAVMYVVTAGTGMLLIIEVCSTSSSKHQCSSSSQCAEETAERVNGNGKLQSLEILQINVTDVILLSQQWYALDCAACTISLCAATAGNMVCCQFEQFAAATAAALHQ
jgi:hypothetical protein